MHWFPFRESAENQPYVSEPESDPEFDGGKDKQPQRLRLQQIISIC